MNNTILITGATSGIGKATAEGLAGKGYNLILVCRNKSKMNTFISELTSTYTEVSVKGFVADFSSFQSIKDCVTLLNESVNRIDVLINNAGTFNLKKHTSPDGYELTFAVNYLGTFLFTKLLLPLLKRGTESRIINVGSDSHYFARFDLADMFLEKRRYSGFKSYSVSKLAILFFTQELANILSDDGITVNCVHPGQVATNIWTFSDNPTLIQKLAAKIQYSTSITPEEGAETVIYLSVSKDVKNISGKYFSNKKEKKPSRKCQNIKLQKDLWLKTSEIVGV